MGIVLARRPNMLTVARHGMPHLLRNVFPRRRSRLQGGEPPAPGATRRWATIATLIGLATAITATFGSLHIAKNQGAEARQAFERQASEIATTLTLAIGRHEAFLEGVKGFLATERDAGEREFDRWARAVRWRQRYPELLAFGLVVPIERENLRAFLARQNAERPRGAPRVAIRPPGIRDQYCLGILGQARTPAAPQTESGRDFCSGPTGIPLERARDTGQNFYYPVTVAEETGVGILSPLYEGAREPRTLAQRRARFIGWVGMQIAQERLLDITLANHSDVALEATFKEIGSSATFSSGAAPQDGDSVTVALSDTWNLTVTGNVDDSIWGSTAALIVLGYGVLLGLLAGVLIFALGSGRARALRRVEAATEELRHRALHDPLTGLPNRALIMDRAEHLLARNRRAGTEGAALFIDLDGFKNVNDTLGHEVGDRLLAAVAERLRGALRDADTLGRIGGDEFVVLIDGGDFASGPELVAERLVEVMREPFEIEGVGTPLTLTLSVGVAKGDRASAMELLRDADVALYEAKASGSNGFAVFDSEMQSEASHRIQLELDLRSALERGEFRLVYQPIYDLDRLVITGVEALLRWEHPTQGTIPPAEFIPILDRTGQIRAVGRWVLEESTRRVREWSRSGQALDLSVNVSARQLEDDRIIEDVRRALERSRLDPARLTLEITETALARGAEATAQRLRRLKELGVRIAVDDFGTGYSSLAYLRQLPVDCLKIDRTLTDGISSSPQSHALIDTLVQLGHDLGLETFAEGIEEPGQIDHLRSQHVTTGQGFWFSAPLEPERLRELLTRPRPNDGSPANQPQAPV